MYIQRLTVRILFLFKPAIGHDAFCLASALINTHMSPPQVPVVSFFDDCLLKTGVVSIKDLSTISFILDCGGLKVTDKDLEPHVAAMHPDGECALTAADMQQLFKRLAPETLLEEPKSDCTESNAEVLDHVATKTTAYCRNVTGGSKE